MAVNLTVIILTKNEEKNIERCIKSLNFCEEILVIDDFSVDRTCELANKHNAKVYIHKLGTNFAQQRNFGIEQSSGRWILFIDADEVVPKELANEIIQSINNKNLTFEGYRIKRVDYIFNTKLKHGEIGNINLLRLARKGVGKWNRRVHEIWEVEGKVGSFKFPLLHYPHQTLQEFVTDVNTMSTLHAQANLEEGKKSNLIKVILFPFGKFISSWMVKQGFLDGTAGIVVALMMSLHSFLAWSKLWLYQKNNISS